jgi:hypothetical protein
MEAFASGPPPLLSPAVREAIAELANLAAHRAAEPDLGDVVRQHVETLRQAGILPERAIPLMKASVAKAGMFGAGDARTIAIDRVVTLMIKEFYRDSPAT